MTRMPLYLDRLQDGEDALPHRVAHTQPRRIGPEREWTSKSVGIGIPTDHELFRMRTRPELFPDWLVDQVNTRRAAQVELVSKHTPVYDWDCRACQHAVVTHVLDARCPKCGN